MTKVVKVKKIANYVLETKIGEGQFGSVYKAYNCDDEDRTVACKIIGRQHLKDKKFLELLESEIEVLSKCDNPNIIKLYDIKKTPNNIYLFLEYCDSGSLSDYLRQNPNISESEAMGIFLQVLNAFRTLNEQKIMHRDLKLENILLHKGKVKVADFGFSKLLDEGSMAKTLLGSPMTMAPEIYDGTPYDFKADVWSLGVCLYQLLYRGRYPFTGKSLAALFWNIQNKELEFDQLIKVSENSKNLLRKMIECDPEIRASWEEIFSMDFSYLTQTGAKKQAEELSTNDNSSGEVSPVTGGDMKVPQFA